MNQQINLYNPALRQPREWLTAKNVALAVAVCFGLAVLGTVAARYRLSMAESEAAAANTEMTQVQGQLNALSSQLAGHKPDAVIERNVAVARSQLKSREETLSALANVSIEPGKGFAAYLRGFSRQTVSGVWMTGLTVGPGSELSIRGRTINQSLVSEYVNRLKSEAAFAGHAFAEVNMAQVVDKQDKATSDVARAGVAPVTQIEFNLVTSDSEHAASPAKPVLPAAPAQATGNPS